MADSDERGNDGTDDDFDHSPLASIEILTKMAHLLTSMKEEERTVGCTNSDNNGKINQTENYSDERSDGTDCGTVECPSSLFQPVISYSETKD